MVDRTMALGRGKKLGAAGAVAAVALVLVVILIKWAPAWLAADVPPDQRGAELGQIRTALFAVVAGVIALVGAYYTSRTFALNRQGHITERFTRAVDQLGHDAQDVRLGAIYALERLARESRVDHGPIVEILLAFIRGRQGLRGADLGQAEGQVGISTDVQAALTVLGRRRAEHDGGVRLDLRDTDLRSARLAGSFQNADLGGCQFAEASLALADLSGATLSRADLAAVQDLHGATLRDAVYDGATKWPPGFDYAGKGAVRAVKSRRLVLCCDGVWNRAEHAAPTNAYKFAGGVALGAQGSVAQLVKYMGPGPRPPLWRRRPPTLRPEIEACYRWLVVNYRPGDEIYLVGFSKGAFVARTIAGVVQRCGILRPAEAGRIGEALTLYRNRELTAESLELRGFRSSRSWEASIRFLGVWETVGERGIPWVRLARIHPSKRRWRFHNTRLGHGVERAYQAVAIDERRGGYQPTLWAAVPNKRQVIQQVWFAGVHADVGGGHPVADLAEIPLQWMIAKAKEAGLVFGSRYFGAVAPDDRSPDESRRIGVWIRADPMGPIHDSRRGIHRLVRPHVRVPGQELSPASLDLSIEGRRRARYGAGELTIGAGQVVAASVAERAEREPSYSPPGLRDWLDGPGNRPLKVP